ncbi:hypothetical protein FHX06_006988 [Rhizobium sp. BK512]|nr:hypothetical protein [Rhizobium sp. BK379]MBB3565618.1 hypothetical protein [Rhizobium sp. BK512]
MADDVIDRAAFAMHADIGILLPMRDSNTGSTPVVAG